jgi:transcriptional regulator with XRE-family HTH domain
MQPDDIRQDVASMRLWEFIRYLREKEGLSARQFGDLIGCSRLHVNRIEKPYRESRCTAGIDLLKRMAEVLTSTEEERLKLERQLLIRFAEIRAPAEIADIYRRNVNVELEHGFIQTGGGMPQLFLERLQRDTDSDGEKAKSLSALIPPTILKEILRGRGLLSSVQVSAIARHMEQPIEEYVRLGGYMTDSVKRVVESKAMDPIIENITLLTPQDLVNIKVVLTGLLDSIISAKKTTMRRGRPRKEETELKEETEPPVIKPKKPRGRPRKEKSQ